MKKYCWCVAQIGLLMLAVSVGGLAENPKHEKFSGLINAYSPQTSSTGPYEVRGTWTLRLKDECSKADFSASLAMELSDGWVLTKNGGNFDPNARGAHTHHVTVIDGDVTPIPNGFRVTGTATITLNGNPAPVSPSQVTIDITGGTDAEFSNIALTFASPASNHFGSEGVVGVVRNPGKER